MAWESRAALYDNISRLIDMSKLFGLLFLPPYSFGTLTTTSSGEDSFLWSGYFTLMIPLEECRTYVTFYNPLTS